MFVWLLGLMVPSASWLKSTTHLKPCFWLRILPIWGRLSSERYSSSPLISTTVLPLAVPALGS